MPKPAMRPAISLHIGAHKTATTSLQSRLANSTRKLRAAGIAYVDMPDFRRLVTSRLAGLRPRDFPATLRRLGVPRSASRVILSDENLLGNVSPPTVNSLYEEARVRVARFLEHVGPDYEVEVFLTVRDYAPYLASRYVESLQHYPFRTFQDYFAKLDLETVSWREVIDSVKAAGATCLRVRDFAGMLADEQSFIDGLLHARGIELAQPDAGPEVRRAKFSKECYDVVEFSATRLGPRYTKALARAFSLISQPPKATEFMPVAPDVRQRLSSRYRAELPAIVSP